MEGVRITPSSVGNTELGYSLSRMSPSGRDIVHFEAVPFITIRVSLQCLKNNLKQIQNPFFHAT